MDQVVDLGDAVLEEVPERWVVPITIQRPLKMHSKMMTDQKKWPKLMPPESRCLQVLTVVTGFEVLFMGQINVLHEIIASVLALTSKSPSTSVQVGKSQFTAGFAPNGVSKAAEIGVFIARNLIQHLWI